jgi:AcrR family transcriptional regulator
MKDTTYQAIVAAIDRLARGKGSTKNGKVTVVNVAAEAGIGKATVYRYFTEYETLRKDYDTVRRRGSKPISDGPATVQDALTLAKSEIQDLRRELAEAEVAIKTKAQQLLLLWSENKSLHRELERHASASVHAKAGNVAPFPTRKR